MTQHDPDAACVLTAALTAFGPDRRPRGTAPKRIDRRYLRDVSGLTDEEVHALCQAREYSLRMSAELRMAR